VFVLKQNGTVRCRCRTGRQAQQACYDLRGFSTFRWLDKVATCIRDLGWDLYSFDHEDANGQYEFDFRYADALTMCDRFISFAIWQSTMRRKKIACHHDAEAFADRTGTGRTFNMSLCDLASGRNLFACSPSDDLRGLGLTEIGYHSSGYPASRARAVCGICADGQQ